MQKIEFKFNGWIEGATSAKQHSPAEWRLKNSRNKKKIFVRVTSLIIKTIEILTLRDQQTAMQPRQPQGCIKNVIWIKLVKKIRNN